MQICCKILQERPSSIFKSTILRFQEADTGYLMITQLAANMSIIQIEQATYLNFSMLFPQ